MIRFQYSILKVHKDFIKTLKDPSLFEDSLNLHTKQNSDWQEIQTHAYKYFITTEKLNYLNSEEAKTKEEVKSYETVEDFLPAGVVFPS